MDEKYSIFDIMNNGKKIREDFLINHAEEISNGTKEFCSIVLKSLINQIKNNNNLLRTFNTFEPVIKEDRNFDDVRKVCVDYKTDKYILVSISKTTKLLDMYGIKIINKQRSGKLNCLYLSYGINREDLLTLLRNSKKRNDNGKKYVRNI